MEQITLSELNERVTNSLRERNLLTQRESGYSAWEEVSLNEPEEFAGALEKVVRDCLTL